MEVTVCLKCWLNSSLRAWFSVFEQIAKKACLKKYVYPCILICHLNPQNLSVGSKTVGLGVTAELTTTMCERWSQKLQKDKERGRELKWGTYALSFLKEKCSALRFLCYESIVIKINPSWWGCIRTKGEFHKCRINAHVQVNVFLKKFPTI